MTKYAVCPELFEYCLNDRVKFLNFLLKFIQTNEHKILLDNEMIILDRYKNIKDPNGFFSFWIDQLQSAGKDAYFLVKTQEKIKSLDNKAATISISSAFNSDRYLATTDHDNYSDFENQIKNFRIKILNSNEIIPHMDEPPPYKLDIRKLSTCLIDKAKTILEKKFTRSLEDIYNDDFSEYLRGQGFYVSDQTRSGRSPNSQNNPGEIDIMLRSKESGAPEAIIESLKLDSCGPKNTTIARHINKLLSDYDTSGLQRNFIVIFSVIANFENAWGKYKSYLSDLNKKPDFTTEHILDSITDTSDSLACPADVRTAIAIHRRNGSNVEIMHIFINMHASSNTSN